MNKIHPEIKNITNLTKKKAKKKKNKTTRRLFISIFFPKTNTCVVIKDNDNAT